VGIIGHMADPPNSRLASLRRRVATPRNLALVIAGAVGAWHAVQGVIFEWVPDLAGQDATASQCSLQGVPVTQCPLDHIIYVYGMQPVPAHLYFNVPPWFHEYLIEGVVLGVVVFLAIATLRVAWGVVQLAQGIAFTLAPGASIPPRCPGAVLCLCGPEPNEELRHRCGHGPEGQDPRSRSRSSAGR
jgi:hypothetical protein